MKVKNIGIETELDKIESNFKQIWEQTLTDDSNGPTVKASSLNLIITCHNRNNFENIMETIPDITEHHPGRIITVFIDTERKDEKITSLISAFCHPPREDGIQICCELISLETGPEGEKHLPGTLLPLLLPDLPVYLWSADNRVLNHPNLGPFQKNIERTILNSPATFTTIKDFTLFLRHTLFAADVSKISDLQWARLTNWRETIARLFDGQSTAKLSQIRQVRILYSGKDFSSTAFFLAGWLSSRLGWQLQGKNQTGLVFSTKDKTIELLLNNQNSEIPVGDIISVEIETDTEKWIIKALKNGIMVEYLQNNISINKEKWVMENPSTSWLIGNELDFVRADDIYLDAVKILLKLLDTEQRNKHEIY